MKFTNVVLKKYQKHCYKSYLKCRDVEEVKDKIERAIKLGAVVRETKHKQYILYGNRLFTYEKARDIVLYMKRAAKNTFYYVSEDKKNEYLMKKIFTQKENKIHETY